MSPVLVPIALASRRHPTSQVVPPPRALMAERRRPDNVSRTRVPVVGAPACLCCADVSGDAQPNSPVLTSDGSARARRSQDRKWHDAEGTIALQASSREELPQDRGILEFVPHLVPL